MPAIAWWPQRIKAGTVSDELLISIDVMPTLLKLSGAASATRKLDGIDFTEVLLSGASLPARDLYWASLSNGGARSEAMRRGAWKLVVNHPRARPGTFDNEKVALYRLDNDPGETTDLAEQHADVAADMLADLKVWFADTQELATQQPGGWPQK